MNLSEKINNLFTSQFREWELARNNYNNLKKVRTRKFEFDTFEILVQFNPERIRSSSAKVDAKSIEERPCFLCEKNRPMEQRGIPLKNGLTILINPFPIFDRHLTIPTEAHIDQRIRDHFDYLLSLAKAIPSYLIFYNGPECGASAPDHFHFQAGNTGFLPIENDFRKRNSQKLIMSASGFEVWSWSSYLRGILSLKGNDRRKLNSIFDRFYNKLSEIQYGRPEPMLNILCEYVSDEWIIHIIPRKRHRPSQFFDEESDNLLVSPAAVDLGGVIIVPREGDFAKIKKTEIEDIFQQVCFSETEVSNLLNQII